MAIGRRHFDAQIVRGRGSDFAALVGWNAAELREELKDAVEVGKAGTEAVDKFVKYKFAVHHCLVVFVDFKGNVLNELGLHAAQRLGGDAATAGKNRIGFLPLAQFRGPLTLARIDLFDQVLE